MPDTRPRTRLGPITFSSRFAHPPLDVSGSAKTATHEVIGGEDRVDFLGPAARRLRLVGHCFPETASQIDDLSREAAYDLRHSRLSTRVIVEDHSAESSGEFIDVADGILRYNYTIDMVESVAGSETGDSA